MAAGSEAGLAAADEPPHPLDEVWDVSVAGRIHGPCSGHEIERLARQGRLPADTMVSRAGAGRWVEMHRVPELEPAALETSRPSGRHAGSMVPSHGHAMAGSGTTIVLPGIELTFVHSIEAAPKVKRPSARRPETGGFRDPGVALLLSLVFAGAGQAYNRELVKGACMAVLCLSLWLVLLGWVVSIWSMADAYTVAKGINLRAAVGREGEEKA